MLDDVFWQQEDEQAEDAMLGLYLLLLLYGASSGLQQGDIGGVDYDDVVSVLTEKVYGYSTTLHGINETTRKRVDQILEQWRESGLGLNVLDFMLEPVFSDARANIIGITEVTAALATGAAAIWAASEKIDEMEWHTAEDGRVCPECEAQRGKVYPADDANTPPLHPGCRCWLSPVKE